MMTRCLAAASAILLAGCGQLAVVRQSPTLRQWEPPSPGTPLPECTPGTKEILDRSTGLLAVRSDLRRENVVSQLSPTDCWAAAAKTTIRFFNAPSPSREEWLEYFEKFGDDGASTRDLSRILKEHIPGLRPGREGYRDTLSHEAVPPSDLVDVILAGGLAMLVLEHQALSEPGAASECGGQRHASRLGSSAGLVSGSHIYLLSSVRYRVVARTYPTTIVDQVLLFDPAFQPAQECTVDGSRLAARLQQVVYVVPTANRTSAAPRCHLP